MSGSTVFGSIGDTGSESGTFAFIALIGTMVALGAAFDVLDKYAQESSFGDILHAIEKELMVAGVIQHRAFQFRCVGDVDRVC